MAGQDTLQGMTQAVKYVASEFLEEKHFKVLHRSLSGQQSKMHSLSAALQLMEQYGVTLSAEEVEKLHQMEEGQQINALVAKMPQQSNDQFQQFFLKLQVLVASAVRVRRALEEGRPDLVSAALEEADSTGIAQYVLRMAIVQAGSEVAILQQQYQTWIQDADTKMSKLIRGQEDAMSAQKKLASAQAQLAAHQTEANEKTRKLLMSFLGGSDAALQAGCFGGWRDFVRKMRRENEIRKEYEERMEQAEMALVQYKQNQLSNVRAVMMKKAAAGDTLLVSELFGIWNQMVKDRKTEEEMQAQLAALEERFASAKGNQAANTKKVMMRMAGDSDAALVQMCFQAFQAHHADYARNREMEDQVKKQEARMVEFLKGKADGAKKIMMSAAGATTMGLMKVSLQGWREVWEDAKREAELSEILNSGNAKFAALSGRGKESGLSACERAALHQNRMIMTVAFCTWKLDTKMEVVLRVHHSRIDGKRQQLIGVQQMFRGFAQQLESGLKTSVDSTRDLREGMQKKRLNKTEGTISLPEIQKPASGTGSSRPCTPKP